MTSRRFTGTVEFLVHVDVGELRDWVAAIPFEEWPQQHPTDDQLKPAMVTDLEWHGFGSVAKPLIDGLMEHFPGAYPFQVMLSAVMPGHVIPAHKDDQPPHWLTRVHVPLITNDDSEFLVEVISYHLAVGKAYRVNTMREHRVVNLGRVPRVHMMFDVGAT